MLIKEPSTTNKITERLQDTLRSPKKSFWSSPALMDS